MDAGRRVDIVVVLSCVRRGVCLGANRLHAHQQRAKLALKLQRCGGGSRGGGARTLRTLRRGRDAVCNSRERTQARSQLRQLGGGTLGSALVCGVGGVELVAQPLSLALAHSLRRTA